MSKGKGINRKKVSAFYFIHFYIFALHYDLFSQSVLNPTMHSNILCAIQYTILIESSPIVCVLDDSRVILYNYLSERDGAI